MEKLVQAEARRPGSSHQTTLCVVRYGNVLCSRGSVVPLFIDQITSARPLGVTVPGMTRFLLRLDDAVDLVETALLHGAAGDIFVRKSPSCTVGVLAQSLLRLFDSSGPVAILGARPGEKMHETLATVEEMRSAQDCGDAWRIPADRSDLIDPHPARRTPHQGRDYNSEHTERLEMPAVMALLAGLSEVQAALAAFERSPLRAAARKPSRAQPELMAQ